MPEIVFMGTPDFAVPAMKSLLGAGHTISLLVCQPDRKKGRGQKFQFPPTKEFALENNIDVFQPDSIKSQDSLEKLASCNPDFFVVIAYGKILPESVLEIPKKGCINVHASLLPKWRGAAPIQFALLNGDERTGVCTMLMDRGMDTGDILQKREIEIEAGECVDTLTERLSYLGAELITETIDRFDNLTSEKQDHDQATYTRLLRKEDRDINWNWDSKRIYGQFRAMTPSPGVVTSFRGKRLIIKSMVPIENSLELKDELPGKIVSVENDCLVVSCSNGLMSILSCQPESKKALLVKDFINGYQVKTEEILGENT